MTRRMAGMITVPIAVLAALSAFSCGRSVPPVPTVSTQGLDADVRAAIREGPRCGRGTTEERPGFGTSRDGSSGAHALSACGSRLSARHCPRTERICVALLSGAFSAAVSPTGTRPRGDNGRTAHPPGLHACGTQARGTPLQAGALQRERRGAYTAPRPEPELGPDSLSTGAREIRQQDFAAAEDLYRRACQAYPTYGAAWYGLAETEKRLGHNADTAKDFELAESYKNSNPPTNDLLLNKS